ncbi:MAG TPA: glycosyltransferase family 2 protein [Euzebyales bacterium]
MVRSEAVSNIEGHTSFDVEWSREQGKLRPGFTAVLRVKDESRNLPHVLPGLLRAVDSVIVVDNGSTDGTPEIARTVGERMGASDRLTVTEYPFRVSRCGTEHLHTHPESVHSLTYFYNWSFSHVDTRYALKWDGDMVLSHEGERTIRDLSWQLEAFETVIVIPRHSLYLASDRLAFMDTGWRNREQWAWPNRPGFSFGKGFEWEIPLQPGKFKYTHLPQFMVFELKWLDLDEFDHWSPHTFEQSVRTGRKGREMDVFARLQEGDVDGDLVRVESDGDEHVVDVVRRRSVAEWDRLVVGAGVPARGVM